MILYPAIDLLDGKVVRLHKGDFAARTVYGDDPVAVAEQFGEAGAAWIHVVDLSGARDGQRRQSSTIAKLCRRGLRIQTGGGVRSARDVEELLAIGVDRVVVGSVAVDQPDRVERWLARYGASRLALAFDVKQARGRYYPATRGWTETGGITLDAITKRYAAVGLQHALVTDISRDGALSGPNVDLYRHLLDRYPAISWQASGGVAELGDLDAVRAVGVAGAIIGKALYEGRFDLREALQCSQDA